MYRWLKERRQKREREAVARKAQIRSKAGATSPQPLESLLPDRSVEAANIQLAAYVAEQDDSRHRHVVQHHYGSGDNIAGSHTHGIGSHSHTVSGSSGHSESYISHAFDNSHSHSFSHDHGSSFDSGSSSFDSGSSW